MTLWRITSNRAVCGLVVDAGRVTERAPYLSRWARPGAPWQDVKARLARAGLRGEPVSRDGVML